VHPFQTPYRPNRTKEVYTLMSSALRRHELSPGWRFLQALSWMMACTLALASAGLPVMAHAERVEVRVRGGDAALRDNVRVHVGEIDSRELRQPRRLEARIQDRARKAMQAMGYYDGSARISGLVPDATLVRVSLDPGEPVRIGPGQITLAGEGRDDPALVAYIAANSPEPGSTLNHASHDRLKRGLMRLCQQRGYLNARFTRAELRVERERRRATSVLDLDTGSRYRFGKITIEGSTLDPKRTRRFVTFKPGDPYDETQITSLYKSMLDSGYFRDVGIKPQKGADAGEVPVDISLRDDLSDHYHLGAGYGTDSGVRTRFQWNKPVFNRLGHATSATAELNQLRKTVAFDYKIPDGHPAKDYFLAQAAWVDEFIDKENIVTTTWTFSHNHELPTAWVQNLFVRLKREKNTDISDAYFVTPGFAFSRLELIGAPIPVSGHRYLIDTEFSDPAIGSDTQYIKAHALAKWLLPLTERQQLLIRVEAGRIQAEDFASVPKTSRFYAGGDQSIRGYAFQSLGPQSEQGSAVGARFLSVGSVEHLWRFADRWQWATFIDSGRLFNDFNVFPVQGKPIDPLMQTDKPADQESQTIGAGMGIRWLSPVGTIGLDVAKQVRNDLDEDGYRIHLYMGPPL
jgi:translocation and assembly module TamA